MKINENWRCQNQALVSVFLIYVWKQMRFILAIATKYTIKFQNLYFFV